MSKPKINRPGFTPSAKATLSAGKDKSKFFKQDPGTTEIIRFLPPAQQELGALVTQHFKLKSPEGDDIALACLYDHGDAETGEACWLCELVEYLRGLKDKSIDKIVKGKDGIHAKSQFIYQVSKGEKQADKSFKWKPIQLWGLSPTWNEDLGAVLKGQEFLEAASFTDADEGQAIISTRTGSGFDTKYKFQLSNQPCCLDDILPGWQDKWISDYVQYMSLRLANRELQRECAKLTYGDRLDWADIDEKVPV